ncbi:MULTISPECIES: cell division protein FtsQ/DivIB [Alteromonadaceae]|uniref:cell division protein FtsQ/DivIB n=1 Tax=Alteromonadaceae TaxID=72275 RepID=UPI0026E44500|nr:MULTISPECIES: cell division protein FtsQ/DivIB [unclassified Aliiglaciecola]MDO6711419.1 cell division protein FtsQ/DivIB [Aliiglaciecola sp. 2_MG-2023]MDO6752604.1 cell division protein FtsQ/DivIB [Aliiglaciecola sp. 1_MG-2023]
MQQLADNSQTNRRYQLAGMVFLAVVLLSLVYAIWWLDNWLEDAQRAPINQVIVSGKRVNIKDELIENTIRSKHPESFFEVDVDRLHREIEALPWVHRASVRKRWPNSLNIHVVEEIASARWNRDSLLNQYGEMFDAQLPDAMLPALFGPGGSEQTALDGYRDMQTLLNSASLSIDELYLSERFAWNLRLKNGIRLNLGRSEYVDRLQRFVDVYPLLKKQDKQVDYIDLRYDTGLAVGWKSASTNEQES